MKQALEAVVEQLRALSNKQLVETLEHVLHDRRITEGEETRWCLAEVSCQETGESELNLLAVPDSRHYSNSWADDAPICQYGDCPECESRVLGCAKHLLCPSCGATVHAS